MEKILNQAGEFTSQALTTLGPSIGLVLLTTVIVLLIFGIAGVLSPQSQPYLAKCSETLVSLFRKRK